MGHVGGMTQAGRVWAEEDSPVFGSFSGSGRSQTDLGLIADECFVAAEEAAEQVLNCIHPTLDSEEKRRDVIDYVQRLVKRHLGCEAFPYGSVPLKTYLPDGDIDLTAFKSLNGEESLPRDVLSILQAEQLNKFAEFEVKDSQFIDAEVKIVKCLVQNIVIDISFNQLGGLSTLCFLEQVDRVVGKNHLFKRSIILVKAWCYYESRILGAHHGLISTYALETLVLYIFNLFYSSLDGPLAVLYKFLEYFSQFDWENYCISLKGPVCISSLPHIVVKMPEGGRYDLLLSEDFLETCMEMFSSSSRNLETTPKAFQPKHLNIIDPLKENNNLGRSVHRGNFYRIRSAFKYGARKLGQVLLQPKDKLAEEIREFFSNTLSRHGQKNNSLIEHSSLVLDDEESLTVSERSSELYSEDGILLKSSIGDFEDDNLGAGMEESETHSSTYGLPISGHCKAEHNTSYCSSSSNDSLGKHCHKSHSFSSKSSGENFSLSSGVHQKFELSSWLESRDMNNAYRWCMDDPEVFYNSNLENGPLKETDIFSTGGESDIPLNPLADLSGDYDCQIRNLLYGQLCNGVFSAARFSSAPPSPSMVRNDNLWDTVHQSMPLDQSQFYQTSSNMLFAVCCADSAFPVAAFGSEGTQKTRGTGTYIPITIGSSRERSVHGRGKYKPQGSRNQYQRHSRSSGYQSNFSESSVKEFHPASSKFQGRGKSDVCCQSPRLGKDDNEENCSENALCQIEFGSLGRLGEDVVSSLSCAWDSTLSISIDTKKQERVTEESLPLKNEDEFPPLCQ